MQTIIVLLNPGKLQNPDMDLRYCVPDRIEDAAKALIKGSGYDFLDAEDGEPGPLLAIWLETANAAENWLLIKELFQREEFKGNDLSQSAQIYISENEVENIEKCSLVFPEA